MAASNVKEPLEMPGYRIEVIESYEMISASLRNELSQLKKEIGYDIGTLFDNGASLWVARLDDKVAHIAWTQTGDKVGRYFFPLTSDYIMISHCCTLPAYRGSHIYPVTLTKLVSALGRRGNKRFFVACSDCNLASIRGIERAGFRLIGRGKVKRCNRLIWYQKVRAGFPKYHASDIC
ncbi:MAG: hypothetical protein KAS69_03330 [Planctomycetes bacterium]|nr:hypothetical protein [Planctomycetota bacterium]